MHSKFKKLMFYLAVFAVGLIQVFGVQAGFLCGCTGSRAVEESCGVSSCHPEEAANEDCAPQESEVADAEERHSLPEPGEHRHTEVRDPLLVVTFPIGATLPPVVFFELPEAFDLPDFRMLSLAAAISETERMTAPAYGSPPMPLLVAETIVMLV